MSSSSADDKDLATATVALVGAVYLSRSKELPKAYDAMLALGYDLPFKSWAEMLERRDGRDRSRFERPETIMILGQTPWGGDPALMEFGSNEYLGAALVHYCECTDQHASLP